jgi:hypothetical protein
MQSSDFNQLKGTKDSLPLQQITTDIDSSEFKYIITSYIREDPF